MKIPTSIVVGRGLKWACSLQNQILSSFLLGMRASFTILSGLLYLHFVNHKDAKWPALFHTFTWTPQFLKPKASYPAGLGANIMKLFCSKKRTNLSAEELSCSAPLHLFLLNLTSDLSTFRTTTSFQFSSACQVAAFQKLY